MRVIPENKDVLQKIEELPSIESKNRCTEAYQYLINSPSSSYLKFLNLYRQHTFNRETTNVFNPQFSEGIECALWPCLYPYTNWCETVIDGSVNRSSTKISFLDKVFSCIKDYGLNFELLQFHYDRWIYKTVTGAINTAGVLKCSPARALEAKTFSAGYWSWQHRILIDSVRQFGFPNIFITISRFEWTFDLPEWLNEVKARTGKDATEMPSFETIHIAHTLEQFVRGYLTGCNNNKWRNHIFNYNFTAQPNVLSYFYRFEFQKRGTVHLHLLVWLRNIEHIQIDKIKAE